MNKSDLVCYLNKQKRLINRAYTCNMLNEYSVATGFGDVLKGDNLEDMKLNLSRLGYSVSNLSYKEGKYSLEDEFTEDISISLPEIETQENEENSAVLDLSEFKGLANNKENRQKIKDYAEKTHGIILKGNKTVETFLEELKELLEV